MEWLFPTLFIVAFLITKKDLALICGAVSMISSIAYTVCDPATWTYEEMLTINIALNLVLAALSQVHWANTRKPLARYMSWIAVAAILINTVQVFSDSQYLGDALLVVQALALFFIFKLDGRKEFMNDVATGLYWVVSIMGAGISNHKSNKG
jgi:hypothetical protein